MAATAPYSSLMKPDIKKYLALKTALLNEKARIEARLGEISQVLGQDVPAATASSGSPSAVSKKRTFSAATKAKMAAAQKARWAKLKGKPASSPAAAPAPKKKRKLSAEGRAAIIAATKARWAKVKAAGKTKL